MWKRFAALAVLVACGESRPPVVAPADLDIAAQPHAVAQPPAEATPPTEPAPPAIVEPPPPAFDPAPTLALLGWKADTVSFQLRRAQHVFAEPSDKSTALGKIVAGTRLPIVGSAPGDRACKAWLAVQPAGWICGRNVKPTTLPPLAEVLPALPPGEILPQPYYDVKEGAPRFADVDAIRAGTPKPEPKTKSTYMVTRGEVVDVDGVQYVQTGVGLIAATDLRKYAASDFAGIDLVATPPPAWPFAWVTGSGAKALAIRATPEKKGATAGTASFRQIVPILEERDGYVRIGEGQWLARSSVRIARKRTRPPVEDAADRWIDVDRDEQVLIAYLHDQPVFATLVSSGRRKVDTPAAIYRLRSKAAITKMAAEEREASHYEVSEVPWATRFRSGLYFHAAYWHDGFGAPRSHGCVNMSPRDAKWVYDWTTPAIPAGWNELEVPMAGAMVVRVFDAKQFDPPIFDYVKEAKERAKIRKQEQELKRLREEAEAAAAAGTSPAVP